VHHDEAVHQMSNDQLELKFELPLKARGEAPRGKRSGEATPAAQGDGRSGADDLRMERVAERWNLLRALRRVQQNQGSRRGWTDGRGASRLSA